MGDPIDDLVERLRDQPDAETIHEACVTLLWMRAALEVRGGKIVSRPDGDHHIS